MPETEHATESTYTDELARGARRDRLYRALPSINCRVTITTRMTSSSSPTRKRACDKRRGDQVLEAQVAAESTADDEVTRRVNKDGTLEHS